MGAEHGPGMHNHLTTERSTVTMEDAKLYYPGITQIQPGTAHLELALHTDRLARDY